MFILEGFHLSKTDSVVWMQRRYGFVWSDLYLFRSQLHNYSQATITGLLWIPQILAKMKAIGEDTPCLSGLSFQYYNGFWGVVFINVNIHAR
jgi:hypothetical protein